MKNRFRLIVWGSRGKAFYCVDTATGKRTSLRGPDRDAAEEIVLAKNQALRQPSLNLQIAKAYLAGSDSGVATRTWRQALDALIATKSGPTQKRWITGAKDKALVPLLRKIVIETRAEDLLAVLQRGTVSTNVHLRKLHNYCLAMTWLPWPIIPKPQWPAVRFGQKRSITAEEHARIIAREGNPERRAFYDLCWHLGGSQSDIAELNSEDIDWNHSVVSYHRRKTQSVAQIHFGPSVETVLRELPASGPLFPYLRTVRSCDRATEFKQRCATVGITGVTLHSYRYAWAERAKICGYPERFAQEALGHNSKAVHRAYAKHATVLLPSLEQYEAAARKGPILQFPSPKFLPIRPKGPQPPSIASRVSGSIRTEYRRAPERPSHSLLPGDTPVGHHIQRTALRCHIDPPVGSPRGCCGGLKTERPLLGTVRAQSAITSILGAQIHGSILGHCGEH